MPPKAPKAPIVTKKPSPKAFNKAAQLGQAEQLRKPRLSPPEMGGPTI